jgi:hypothetical protein
MWHSTTLPSSGWCFSSRPSPGGASASGELRDHLLLDNHPAALLDHFLFGSSENYAYFSPADFVNYILHFSGSTFHPGQAIEIVTVLIALLGYAIWVKRAIFGTVEGRVAITVEMALLVLFTLLSLFIMATPGAYMPWGH